MYHISYHDASLKTNLNQISPNHWDSQFTFTFRNFFHPWVGELLTTLNRGSLKDMLDAGLQERLSDPSKQEFFNEQYHPDDSNELVQVSSSPKKIDVSPGGPYSNYNWELFFHIPLTVAVHLSKSQRFAEAQRWFHFIFDPTSNEQNADPKKRFWKFLAFRIDESNRTIDDIVRILSTPTTDQSNSDQCSTLAGYDAIQKKPFQPHAVARTRYLAYQYSVVMKYLDNLIAWGDSLFQQDTVESINEATQIYVLGANILGERPERVPVAGTVRARSFAELKATGLGKIGDALVDLEAQFPFNFATLNSGSSANSASSSPLLGIGRTLYFCIPPNDKLLSYWDRVSDRLFKIRHCMNIAGVVRPLALFDPPIDPAMLVKAAAAGIDVGSIVNGLNQPSSPVRCMVLIQKALELCGEVRGLGNALLSAFEKGDAEHLALIRQGHESQIQQMTLETRFLQFKSAQESTKSLLTSRATVLERLHFYQRLLGLPADQNAPDTLTLDQAKSPDDSPKLTAENFDQAYAAFVGHYDKTLTLQQLPQLAIASDPSSGGLATLFSGSPTGGLYLNTNEDAELNSHLPRARDFALLSSSVNALATAFAPVPDVDADFHFWGLGGKAKFNVGTSLVMLAKTGAEVLGIIAGWERAQAEMASKTALYQRRLDEWVFQYNLAAHEVMQIGRQILTSLISESIAHHEYQTLKQQIANAQEVDWFLNHKFTNEQLYLWMQGEISRLYYEYYRFAFDTARKAERTMKQELMRPELDAQDFVQFNYWDGGRKGLLSGEALYLDVKRMELAYHENNRRELELTKHVSLRQLSPLALLSLKASGTCQVSIPEWLYDLDCPGHYMRRVKSVAVSIPAVAGPYTSVNCTLSLLRSTIRKDPTGDDYARSKDSEDSRFADYMGAIQSIVTSGGQNDSGMFETNLRDERFLPFEGAGAESTWQLQLPSPKDYPAFDYMTISDVIIHVRYTARQGVVPTKVKPALEDQLKATAGTGLALLFSLRHEFPTEWSLFVSGAGAFAAVIRKDYFPYFTQGKTISITGLEIYDGKDVSKHQPVGNQAVWDTLSADLSTNQAFTVSPGEDAAGPTPQVLTRKADAQYFLIIRYSLP